MGRLGYQSDAQSSLHISYNSLAQYAESMHTALTQPYPPYEDIGVKVDGEYRQLNAALLQIENEFYGTIRPKRRISSGERPLTALRARGVEYVEVRCLDLNPFLPVGIDELQIRFLDVFLLYCLIADSPPDSQQESDLMGRNQLAIVERGRTPGLMLHNGKEAVSRDDWADEILAECKVLAELFDQATRSDLYSYALAEQATKVNDPGLTPSARMLAVMQQQGIPFFRFAMNQSIAHKGYFDEHPLRGGQLAEYQATSENSLIRQGEIEAADSVDFDTFLETYLALA
jgi:glutamate--cysteine ligase